jgi:hypothetical protein
MNEPASPPHDDGLSWLREIRQKLSAESDNDPRLYVEKMREYQSQYKDRLVRVRKVLEPAKAP